MCRRGWSCVSLPGWEPSEGTLSLKAFPSSPQAQLSRNKLLIAELREENRGFAVALQAAELKQKSTEEKNQVLEEQASALKQLIGKITPASLSV